MNKLLIILLILLNACSFTTKNNTLPIEVVKKETIKNGSFAINRTIPKKTNIKYAYSLGFLPHESEDNWLLINKNEKTIKLMENKTEVKSFIADFNKVIVGEFEIALKQEKPLWHATETYFQKRKMEIPETGSKNRYLRGALGNKALFLENNLVIFSSPVSNSEVEGIQVNNEVLDTLYKSLQIGTKVVIF